MRFKCSMCEHVFASATAPTACPSCKGTGKARYPKRLPAKRTTHKQRRANAKALLGRSEGKTHTYVPPVVRYTDGVGALTREHLENCMKLRDEQKD